MKSIVILIDGVSPNQMKKYMPSLSTYAKDHHFAEVISMLGYSTGIHPSIWSGKYQDEHDHFTTFYFDPKNSPFKWVKFLRIIPTEFLRKYFLAALKAPYFLLPYGKKITPRFIKKGIIPLPPAMPVEIAPYFSANMLENDSGTIFEELMKKHVDFSRQSDSKGYFGEYHPLKEMQITHNTADFFYFYRADELGHMHGPHSKEVQAYLQLVDKKIFELLKEAKSVSENVNLLVFSDHGMCQVTKFIDVQKILSATGLKNGKDYLAFYDSTMARFWPLTQGSQEIIINQLSRSQNVIFLDESLRKRYRISFKDKKKYGELIFLMAPETRIFPDYFAPIKGGIKGWHGFDPEFPDSKAIFVSNMFIGKKEIKIVDLFPYIKKAISGARTSRPSSKD